MAAIDTIPMEVREMKQEELGKDETSTMQAFSSI